MNNNEEFQEQTAEQREQSKKKVRLIIFSSFFVLCIFTLFIFPKLLHKPAPVAKQPEVVQLGKIDIELQAEETKDLFYNHKNLLVPNFFNKSDIKEENNNFSVKAIDNSSINYEGNIPLTKEEDSIYIQNNLQFFGIALNSKVYPKYEIKNKDKYDNLDPIYTKTNTYHSIVYDEGESYKYVVFNVRNTDANQDVLSVFVINVSKTHKEYYDSTQELKKQHFIFLKHMLFNYNNEIGGK